MHAVAERLAGALTLVALVAVVVTFVALARRQVPAWLQELALPTATVITAVATVGSLWMSEVAGYIPCELCWYQRIAMYPLPIVLGVAWWRGDGQVWRTVTPLAALGGAVSIWHLAVERVPSLAGACDPATPCAVRWVEAFGVFTLPAMALVGFVAAIVLSLAARPAPEVSEPTSKRTADVVR